MAGTAKGKGKNMPRHSASAWAIFGLKVITISLALFAVLIFISAMFS